MANSEIAHHEQFLYLSQSFQKSSAPEASESVCMRERVNLYLISRSASQIAFSSNYYVIIIVGRQLKSTFGYKIEMEEMENVYIVISLFNQCRHQPSGLRYINTCFYNCICL